MSAPWLVSPQGARPHTAQGGTLTQTRSVLGACRGLGTDPAKGQHGHEWDEAASRAGCPHM